MALRQYGQHRNLISRGVLAAKDTGGEFGREFGDVPGFVIRKGAAEERLGVDCAGGGLRFQLERTTHISEFNGIGDAFLYSLTVIAAGRVGGADVGAKDFGAGRRLECRAVYGEGAYIWVGTS